MNGYELRELIGSKRPRYKECYKPLMDKISQKGDTSGKGGFSSFGAYYQTFMYAFVLGYRLGECKPLNADGDKGEKPSFAPLSNWKPTEVKDYILAILLNQSKEMGYTWEDLTEASDEALDAFALEMVRRMEGYANAGLEYLQYKWDNEEVLFHDPFVFVNILEDLEKE